MKRSYSSMRGGADNSNSSSLITRRERPYLFSTIGAQFFNSNKNRFQFTLSQPLSIPPEAQNCSLSAKMITVWNTVPNITVTQYLYVKPSLLGSTVRLEFLPGLYSLNGLNDTLIVQMGNKGLSTSDPLLILSGDESTGRALITATAANVTLFMDDSKAPFVSGERCDQIRLLLGFTSDPLVFTSIAANQIFSPPSQAAFNQLNSFHIGSNLVSGGLRVNNSQYGTIAVVPVTSTPGSQIVFQPSNPLEIPADDLIGRPLSNIQFWITDEQNRDIVITETIEILIVVTFYA